MALGWSISAYVHYFLITAFKMETFRRARAHLFNILGDIYYMLAIGND